MHKITGTCPCGEKIDANVMDYYICKRCKNIYFIYYNAKNDKYEWYIVDNFNSKENK